MSEGINKPGKQESIKNSIASLRKVTDQLIDFIDIIESNNSTIKEVESNFKEPTMPFASFLEHLPEMIDIQGKRIGEAVVRMKNLLY